MSYIRRFDSNWKRYSCYGILTLDFSTGNSIKILILKNVIQQCSNLITTLFFPSYDLLLNDEVTLISNSYQLLKWKYNWKI